MIPPWRLSPSEQQPPGKCDNLRTHEEAMIATKKNNFDWSAVLRARCPALPLERAASCDAALSRCGRLLPHLA